jgi:hypothetical protein
MKEAVMTREEAERQIRELLASEDRAVILSNKLFTPNGLFSQLGQTLEERREVIKSDLWRDAMARMRELESREAEALDEATKVIRDRLPSSGYRVWLQPIESK